MMTDPEREQAQWWFDQPDWAARVRMFRGARKTTTVRCLDAVAIGDLELRGNLILSGGPAQLRDCTIAGDFTCDDPETQLDTCYIFGVVTHPKPQNIRNCILFDHAEHRALKADAWWGARNRIEPYTAETVT